MDHEVGSKGSFAILVQTSKHLKQVILFVHLFKVASIKMFIRLRPKAARFA